MAIQTASTARPPGGARAERVALAHLALAQAIEDERDLVEQLARARATITRLEGQLDGADGAGGALELVGDSLEGPGRQLWWAALLACHQPLDRDLTGGSPVADRQRAYLSVACLPPLDGADADTEAAG